MQIENPYQQYMYSYPHKTAYGPLKDIHLRDYLDPLTRQKNSLYFHIPFCQYKCGYCNLFSVAGQSEQWMQTYVDAMEQQARQLSAILPENVEFADLTLGGGTPLILPVPLLRRVFSLAKECFQFEADTHSIVVETSPNQTTVEKLTLLKEEGVNRISIGVQSFQEAELSALRRFHSVEAAKKALAAIKKMSFDCMNIDLIYGIPGQTIDSLLHSLKQALEFEPEELFVYPLYIKPDTLLYQQGAKRAKDTLLMHQHVRNFLKAEGYQPHSMRRFVKEKNSHSCSGECKTFSSTKRENSPAQGLPEALCGFGNTISIGCGGRSYVGNLHFCTPYAVKQQQCLSILTDYINRTDYLQITHGFLLSPEEQKRRYTIKHILFGRGIHRKDYRKHFGTEAQLDFPQIIEWEQSGYVTIEEDYITLTEEGFALSDYLGPQLISSDVQKKIKAKERFACETSMVLPRKPKIL